MNSAVNRAVNRAAGGRVMAMVTAAGAALALAGWCGVAAGQNALGDGRGQQRDTRRDTRIDNGRYGVNQSAARDPLAAQRLQNAIITGNAPNGLSFRGNVGYTDPNDFRGRLPSDDLYRFRRDSLYSGLGGAGIRGTEALQYQFALTTGGVVSSDAARAFNVGRDSRGASGASALANSGRNVRPASAVARTLQDLRGDDSRVTNTLRSTSSYATTRDLTPALVSQRRTGQTQVETVTSSSLLGLQRRVTMLSEAAPGAQPVTGLSAAAGSPTGAGAAGTFATPEARSTTTILNTNTASATPAGATGAGAASGVTAARARSAFEEIEARATQAGIRAGTEPEGAGRGFTGYLDELQRRLTGRRGTEDSGNAQPTGRTAAGTTSGTNSGTTGGTPTGTTPTGTERMGAGTGNTAQTVPDAAVLNLLKDPDGRPMVWTDPTFIAALRQAGGRVERYVPPTDPTVQMDQYELHMQAGTRLLAQRRYFDAEERFARALATRPGDVTAAVARAHAQLGAGTWTAAERDLRQVLLMHPTMIAAQYGAELLPDRTRLGAVAGLLREQLTSTEGAAGLERLRLEAGVLLAYLGYQMQDPELLKAGLDAYGAAAEKAGSDADKTLGEVIKRVWVVEQPGAAMPGGEKAPGEGASVTPEK